MNSKKVTLIDEEVMAEIEDRLTDLLEDMTKKHGAVIEEMFICLTTFAVELQEAIETFKPLEQTVYKPKVVQEVTISDEQKAINAKMN